MLQVFFGTDEVGVRQAAHAALGELVAADDTRTTYRLEPDQYEVGQLASASATVSLFASEAIYLIDMPSLAEPFAEELLAVTAALQSSAHHFIVIEKSVLAAQKKVFAAAGATLHELKRPAQAAFNPFSLAEAVAQKDKRALWLLLQEAKENNSPVEEIIGILWWQIKTLYLASLTATATEAGVKDYPYNKAKRALAQFKPGEVETLALSLLTLYHEGHSGRRDIDLALEEWVLSH